MSDNEDNDNNEVETALNKYENSQSKEDSSGLSSVSRVGGRGRATQVIAEVDSRGVFKTQKAKELLIDLSARANFRSRNERIYFMDWVDWCEEFGVGYEGPILYLSTSRSENGESIRQLIQALTSVRHDQHVYNGNGSKGKKEMVSTDPLAS